MIYADDIKIYHRINSFHDQFLLQQELQLIYEWSVLNKLKLNCNKCKVLSFCRSHSKLEFNYALGAHVLEEVGSIRDFGIIFESNFEFKLHLEAVTSQAYSLLGFIIRSTKKFKNVDSIIAIYRSLVLSKLLFGSVIWSPLNLFNINFLDTYLLKVESLCSILNTIILMYP